MLFGSVFEGKILKEKVENISGEHNFFNSFIEVGFTYNKLNILKIIKFLCKAMKPTPASR